MCSLIAATTRGDPRRMFPDPRILVSVSRGPREDGGWTLKVAVFGGHFLFFVVGVATS